MLRCRISLCLSTAIAAAALCLSVTGASAFETGVTTLSFGPSGCNQCHVGGETPIVKLDGPTLVAPGSTHEYTLQVNAVGSQNDAGLNVSAPAGVLATGGSDAANTQVLAGAGDRDEITQTTAKEAVDGVVTFTFLWTAPPSGAVTLTAWGNAVNGNFKRSGDRAATTDLTIAVGDATPGACVGDCDGSGDVTVNEIIVLVNVGLGTGSASACPNGIPSGSEVDITLIIQAVNNALNGCGAG
jgi:hypothetical protein